MNKSLLQSSIISVLIVCITGCAKSSPPNNLTAEQNYPVNVSNSNFSTKALSSRYLQRKLKKFILSNGTLLVRELKYQSHKDYELLKEAVNSTPGMFDSIFQVGEVNTEMKLNPEFASKINDLSPVPLAGLLAYYPFNGNASDQSGNNNNGTVNGAVLTEDRHGVSNSAYYFTGYNNITASVNALPVGNSARTMSMWFKMNSTDPENEMFLIYGNQTANDATYFVETQNTICQGKWYGGDTCNSSNINDNTWHHALLTYDPVNKMKFYLDGTFIGGRYEDYSTSAVTTLYMGSYFHRYYGALDEIRIYNRALNEQEIQALYRG